MRSKLIKLTMAVIGAFTICSCSYFFGEKEDKKNSYSLTIDEKTGVNCVKRNNDLISDYFNMKRSDQEIAVELREMKTCIRDTVELFVKHTRTSVSDPDTYSARDIHDFLYSIFDTYDLAPQFMVDAFRLKDSLIGGSDVKITKDEVRSLPDYVDYVYESLATLAPERHILFKTDFKTADGRYEHPNDWDKFAPAAAKLTAVVKGFHDLKFKKTGEFDYQNMVKVIMYFIDDPEDKEHWTKSFNLINTLQSLITSGQRDTLDIQKLDFACDQLAMLYLAYVEYYRYLLDDYFFQDMATVFTFPALVSRAVERPEAFAGNNPVILNSVHVRILKAMSNSAIAAPNGKLSLDYIDDIVMTLKFNKDLPDYINPDTLKGMFPKFFNLWLSEKACQGTECDSRVLTSAQVMKLQSQLDDWTERQMWINKIAPRDGKSLRRDSTVFRKRSQVKNIKSMQATIEKVNHVRWGDKYLTLGPIVGAKELTFKDLVVFHDIYTLAALFARPFNNNEQKPQMLDYFLDRDQALTFYQWFRTLGLELKLLDPRSAPDSLSAFTEINMFGSTADEPDQLNLSELIEYFEITISTSFRAVDIIENEFANCRTTNISDVFGYEKLDPICFRREWFKSYDRLLYSSLPRLQRYLKTTTDSDLKEFLNFHERAARQGLIVNEPIETDSLRQLTGIIQYAESLFNRFDSNDDDRITSPEMKRALNHIIPNITGILKTSVSEKTVALLYKAFPKFEEDLITYVIVKHELPGILTSDTMAGTLPSAADMKLFKLWSDSKNDWLNNQANVSRNDVLLVVSGLSSLARVTKIKALKSHFYDNELEFQKTLSGPQDPLYKPLAKQLACSYKIEQDVFQWLHDNKKRYWDETLDAIQPGQFVLFGWDVASLGLSWNDIPQLNDIAIENVPFIGEVNLKGLTKGWESQVAYKLIQLVKEDPKLGPLCGVPYLPAVHNIPYQQSYREQYCWNHMFMIRQCKDYYRNPY